MSDSVHGFPRDLMRETVKALPVPSVNPAHGVAATGVQALSVRRHNGPASVLQRTCNHARAIARKEPVRRPPLRGVFALHAKERIRRASPGGVLAFHLAVVRQDGLTSVVHPRPVVAASGGNQTNHHTEQSSCGTPQKLACSFQPAR